MKTKIINMKVEDVKEAFGNGKLNSLEPFVTVEIGEANITKSYLSELIIAHLLTRTNAPGEVVSRYTIHPTKEDGAHDISIRIESYPALYKRCLDFKLQAYVEYNKKWKRAPHANCEVNLNVADGVLGIISQLEAKLPPVVEAINDAFYFDKDEKVIQTMKAMIIRKATTEFSRFMALRTKDENLSHHATKFILGEGDDKEEFLIDVCYEDGQYDVLLMNEEYNVRTKAIIPAAAQGVSVTGVPKLNDLCYTFSKDYVKEANNWNEIRTKLKKKKED